MQHLVDALFVATGQDPVALHASPTRCALLVAVVTAPGLAMPDLSATGAFETLGSTLVRLHLWHCVLLCLFGLIGVVDVDFDLVAIDFDGLIGRVVDFVGDFVIEQIVIVVMCFGFQLGRHVM